MKITKLGHCCLLIEEGSLRILTDPGAWTTGQNEVKGIDLLLITHEHPDHLHVKSVEAVLKNNPNIRVITNSAVGKILAQSQIAYELLEHGQSIMVLDTLIEGFGNDHAEIYETYGLVQNTGYFINNKLFYPGDAFYNPPKSVEVLALPMPGSWAKMLDVIEYAKKVKPKKCFPVHDGMFKIVAFIYNTVEAILTPLDIVFFVIEENKEYEL